MEGSSIARLAYVSFVHNRLFAAHTVEVLEARRESRWSLVPYFGPKRRRGLQRKIDDKQQRIAEYRLAEKGLLQGDFVPAIETLRRVAGEIDVTETMGEMIDRLAQHSTPLESILNSPQIIATGMRRLAYKLEKLSKDK